MQAMTSITSLEALRQLYDPARERSVLKELTQLDVHAQRFISLSPFVVISTHGAAGASDASPRGGAAGFAKAPTAQTILIPDSPGNNRLDSLENIIATGQIGLLFFVPGVDETLRVNGTAALSTDEAERALCADMLTGTRRVPKLVIRVKVQASYLHCAKALMRSELWNCAHHVQRNAMPSMGEMLRDQVADRMSPETVFETQEQMLVRYKQTL
jgi:PPOX class probable FMN-dependent enzyme